MTIVFMFKWWLQNKHQQQHARSLIHHNGSGIKQHASIKRKFSTHSHQRCRTHKALAYYSSMLHGNGLCASSLKTQLQILVRARFANITAICEQSNAHKTTHYMCVEWSYSVMGVKECITSYVPARLPCIPRAYFPYICTSEQMNMACSPGARICICTSACYAGGKRKKGLFTHQLPHCVRIRGGN